MSSCMIIIISFFVVINCVVGFRAHFRCILCFFFLFVSVNRVHRWDRPFFLTFFLVFFWFINLCAFIANIENSPFAASKKLLMENLEEICVRNVMRSIHPSVVRACVRMSEANVYRRVPCFFHYFNNTFPKINIQWIRNNAAKQKEEKNTHTHIQNENLYWNKIDHMHTHYYITHYATFASKPIQKQMVTWKAKTDKKSNEWMNERKEPIGSELEYASSERVHRKGADHAM